jgi:hypothetical protein
VAGRKWPDVQADHRESPSNVLHLLAHIYVSRSEALWKEASALSFFESAVTSALPLLDNAESLLYRGDALARIQEPRDPIDEAINVPLFICRHVLCSESTSFLGFLPKEISSRPFNAYDPLPPTTAISQYDSAYFSGLKPQRAGATGAAGMVEGFMERFLQAVEGGGDWRGRVAGAWADVAGRREFANVPAQQREGILQQVSQRSASWLMV